MFSESVQTPAASAFVAVFFQTHFFLCCIFFGVFVVPPPRPRSPSAPPRAAAHLRGPRHRRRRPDAGLAGRRAAPGLLRPGGRPLAWPAGHPAAPDGLRPEIFWGFGDRTGCGCPLGVGVGCWGRPHPREFFSSIFGPDEEYNILLKHVKR